MRLSRIVGAVLPGRRRASPEAEGPDAAPGIGGAGSASGHQAAATRMPEASDPSEVRPEESVGTDLLALLPPDLREPSPEPEPEEDLAEEPKAEPVSAAPAEPPAAPRPAPPAVAEMPDPGDLLALLPPELREGAAAPPAALAPAPLPDPTPIPAEPMDLGALLAAEFRQPTRHRPEAERAARPAPPSAPPAPARARPSSPASTGPDISAAADLAGFLAACLVDAETGLLLASEGGGGLDLEATAAVSSIVLRAELEALAQLGLDDRVEEILATTGRQLHLLRPLERTPGVFLFVALDRKSANLGMARRQIARIEAGLEL